jgi:hypothetical protein
MFHGDEVMRTAPSPNLLDQVPALSVSSLLVLILHTFGEPLMKICRQAYAFIVFALINKKTLFDFAPG